MSERDYEREAQDWVRDFNALPESQRRAVVGIIADANHARDALDRGDFSKYALAVALRKKYGLPALADV
jgi:hypothetical protein